MATGHIRLVGPESIARLHAMPQDVSPQETLAKLSLRPEAFKSPLRPLQREFCNWLRFLGPQESCPQTPNT
jgi:hypothetical protein